MSDADANVLGTADIREILKLLPHRYPFLLVDRIIDIDGDNSAVGIKNVTGERAAFHRAFPGTADHARRAADRGHGPDGRRHLRAQDGRGHQSRSTS